MLDVPVPQVSLQRSGVVPFARQREAAGVPHVWMRWEAQIGSLTGALHVVNGEPRSEVNINGDLGSCSRCSFRGARSPSPRMGCVAGLPCFTLRTCRTAPGKSI